MLNLPFNLFSQKNKEKFAIGLDIGSSQIKAVKIREASLLEGIALQQLTDDLEAPLKKVISALEIKRANISTSGLSAILRYVNFPKMKDDELQQAMKFEAQKHIPFSLTDVNLDTAVLKHDLPDNKMLVMLAAAKKEFINQRLRLLENLGVKVNIIDIDSLALLNAFNFNYAATDEFKNKAVALLNIGASFSNLNILEAGTPRLSRDINIAGSRFTQRVADMLAVDLKAAEALKINPERDLLAKINSAVEGVLSSLAVELRTSFDYYESQSTSTVVKIFLSGGGSKFSGLKDTLANILGIEIEDWDPFRNIKAPNKESLKENAGSFAVAVGLGLRA